MLPNKLNFEGLYFLKLSNRGKVSWMMASVLAQVGHIFALNSRDHSDHKTAEGHWLWLVRQQKVAVTMRQLKVTMTFPQWRFTFSVLLHKPATPVASLLNIEPLLKVLQPTPAAITHCDLEATQGHFDLDILCPHHSSACIEVLCSAVAGRYN